MSQRDNTTKLGAVKEVTDLWEELGATLSDLKNQSLITQAPPAHVAKALEYLVQANFLITSALNVCTLDPCNSLQPAPKLDDIFDQLKGTKCEPYARRMFSYADIDCTEDLIRWKPEDLKRRWMPGGTTIVLIRVALAKFNIFMSGDSAEKVSKDYLKLQSALAPIDFSVAANTSSVIKVPNHIFYCFEGIARGTESSNGQSITLGSLRERVDSALSLCSMQHISYLKRGGLIEISPSQGPHRHNERIISMTTLGRQLADKKLIVPK